MLLATKMTYEKFKDFLNGSELSPNIRGLAIKNGIRSASTYEIEKLWQILWQSQNMDERKEIISSIGNIQSEWTAQIYLEKSIEDPQNESITDPERLQIITSVVESGRRGIQLVLKFLSQNLEQVFEVIKTPTPIFTSIAVRITDNNLDAQFQELLDVIERDSWMLSSEVEIIKRIVAQKTDWQSGRLKSFETTFFHGKCESNGATNLVSFSTLCLVFSSIIFHFKILI